MTNRAMLRNVREHKSMEGNLYKILRLAAPQIHTQQQLMSDLCLDFARNAIYMLRIIVHMVHFIISHIKKILFVAKTTGYRASSHKKGSGYMCCCYTLVLHS